MSNGTAKLEFVPFTRERLEHYRSAPTGPVDFISEQCCVRDAMDGGRSWVRPTLTPLQRQVVLDVFTAGEPPHTMLLSWGRKMGKTLLASLMWVYRVCCLPNELILLAGPTRDAATELAFTAAADVFDRNGQLRKAVGAVVEKRSITIRATGSEIRAVARTLGATAGSDWTVCHVDELWAFQDKSMVEYYRTLTTPSPSRKSPLLAVTSYAPIRGRSVLLEQLLARAKRGEPGLYASIVSGADAITAACPWITKKFLRQMKRTQPAKVFRRVFLNRATADTDEADRYAFSRQQVADAIDPAWLRQTRRPDGMRGLPIIGVDFASKHDAAAVACLARLKDTLALLDLTVKHGTKREPLSAFWVLEVILEMVSRFGPCKVIVDPLGLADVIAALKVRGFELIEVSHKGPQIADKLYRAIAGRRLRLYAKAGLVTTADGRQYGLEDELHNLLFDAETYKIGHTGEGTQPGRHYDDRATAIGIALQAPELDLANSTVVQRPRGALMMGEPKQPYGAIPANELGSHAVRIFAAHQNPFSLPGRGSVIGRGAPSFPNFGFSKRYF